MPEDPQDPALEPFDVPEPSPAAPVAAVAELGDPISAMTRRYNLPVHSFSWRFFRDFRLDDTTVERLRALEAQGSVVYVMRYASRLDYFLFNTLFLRHGLRLSRFANGIRFYYYRPILDTIRRLLGARSKVEPFGDPQRSRRNVRELARAGESFFLFLRTARLRIGSRRQVVLEGRAELDLLEEVVRSVWNGEKPVHVVPLAIFWRKGPRSRRRFLNLFYGAATRPSDLAKVTSFLTTYRDLAVKVGDPIDLGAFIDARRAQGEHSVARMVRRSILTFLYREEKVVEGPTLRPRHKIQQVVVSDSGVQQAIHERAADRHIPIERAQAEAEKMFREIAAHMNSTFLALLNVVVSALTRRLFANIEVNGIDKVADYAKLHPLILVPSHRSYFDFLIISIVFYANYLVPPHIAARENMAFGPFGFLWRRVGAFFMRNSFDDALYKQVFRAYLSHLLSEGVTQEFFIEGGRSRTGKTLPPRLGILSWEVEAFLGTARRDLFFVPIALTYERLVEEGALVEELEGGQKQRESLLGLVRARKFLQRRFGSVMLNFGEPVSLAAALGDRRARLAGEQTPEVVAEKRIFIGNLGNRIVERINWAMVPNATAVAACGLLGDRRRGLFRTELVGRMQEIVELLRLQDVKLTPALDRDAGTFQESIVSILRMDLVRSDEDPRGEILYFEESKRRALDFYRNSIVHFLATPSFMARRLLAGPVDEDLRPEVGEWLRVFYREFFTPPGEVMAAHLDGFIDHFERKGWLERREGEIRTTEKGVPTFRFLAEQTRAFVEAYYATCSAVLAVVTDREATVKELRKAAEEQFERAWILGEVERREAANPMNFANAVAWLVDEHILEQVQSQGKGDPAYGPGEAFGELTALRERLACALPAR